MDECTAKVVMLNAESTAKAAILTAHRLTHSQGGGAEHCMNGRGRGGDR